MAMTREQWAMVERRLGMFMYPVRLLCDGYVVQLKLGRLSTMRNAISVYVDGVIKGAWLLDDCEERRRFMRPVKRHLYTKRQREMLVKAFGKREAKKRGFLDKRTSYRPYWTSVTELRRHIARENEDVHLLCQESDIAHRD